MDIDLNSLLFKVHTPHGVYHEYRYDEALKYYDNNEGFLLIGYTADLFPDNYILKKRQLPHNNWFIMIDKEVKKCLKKKKSK